MDDILKDHKRDNIEQKLQDINSLHSSLTFTLEREKDGSLPMLDMKILNREGNLSSTWYSKPSSTGLIMNYHALAPQKYKRAVVTGLVHRIFRSCSNWTNVHDSLEKGKVILKSNQYPPDFFEPIIRDTLSSIVSPEIRPEDKDESAEKPFMIFLQYRGKCSEPHARDIRPDPTTVHVKCCHQCTM